MRKSFLADEQSTYLVNRGNSIMPPAELVKAKALETKYSITLTDSKLSNIQIYRNAIKSQIDLLPASDPFLVSLQQRKLRETVDAESILFYYMKFIDVYDSEYQLLTSAKWDELQKFIIEELGSEGISTVGGIKTYIDNAGDYSGVISGHSKAAADPVTIKASGDLVKAIDNLTVGLSNTEKANVSAVVQQYITAFDKPLSADEFHNLLFFGK